MDSQRVKVRSTGSSVCVSDILSSSDESDEPQILSRDDLGVQNLPFCKVLGKFCKPNFCERRAAYKRKYSFELKLTPILKTKLEFIVLLFLAEFVDILYKIATYTFLLPHGRRYKEEAKFVLENVLKLNFDTEFFREYLNGPCVNGPPLGVPY